MAMSGSELHRHTFALDTAKSTKTTKVHGTCTLAFVAGRQPGRAPERRHHAVDFDPSVTPVQVKVLDGSNNLSSFPASISMAIGDNPGGGTLLDGTTTDGRRAGHRVVRDLTIDEPGRRLHAGGVERPGSRP